MSTKTLPKIEEINSPSYPENQFFTHVNILFETAPPLANGLLKSKQTKPFASWTDLIDRAQEIISQLSFEDKIIVINAHPRIGTNPANEKLSAMSYKEQGCDKDKEMPQDAVEKIFAELRQLNEAYEKKFGFEFVVFVNGRTKQEIIPVLRQRLQSSAEEELKLGLSEMMNIARDRLKKMQQANL